jgi:hypothetical protein
LSAKEGQNELKNIKRMAIKGNKFRAQGVPSKR